MAVVLFSKGFWDSEDCLKELEQIVALAEDQRIGYLPVFLYSTGKEVAAAARDHAGKKFSLKVRLLADAPGLHHFCCSWHSADASKTLGGRWPYLLFLGRSAIAAVCATKASALTARIRLWRTLSVTSVLALQTSSGSGVS